MFIASSPNSWRDHNHTNFTTISSEKLQYNKGDFFPFANGMGRRQFSLAEIYQKLLKHSELYEKNQIYVIKMI